MDAKEQCQSCNQKGPAHERFRKMAGTWTMKSKVWMAPGAEPFVGHGTAESRLVLDGRYVEQLCRWQCGEHVMEGRGIDGFDVIKQKYVSTWIDSMSTGICVCEGTADATDRVITYFGKMDCPTTGQRDKTVKSVVRELSDDEVLFEMYDVSTHGQEFKFLEVAYQRRT